MQLIKNPRFIEEYKLWSEKISKITDQDKKLRVSELLNRLVGEIKKIDIQHNNFNLNQGIGNSIKDSRDEISHLRKKIFHELDGL